MLTDDLICKKCFYLIKKKKKKKNFSKLFIQQE